MKETTNQDCPLCGSAAEYILVDYGNRKFFRCPRCGLYQVSLRAEKVLGRAPQPWRDGYAQKAAQCPAGHVLVILVPSPPRNTDHAHAALSGSYVPLSDVPQGQ